MSLVTAVGSGADMVDLVRERISIGAEIREVEYMDMPLWLFAELDLGRQVRNIFQSESAALVVYTDGSRLLRRVPSSL